MISELKLLSQRIEASQNNREKSKRKKKLNDYNKLRKMEILTKMKTKLLNKF